jgi:uncharacterized protein YaaR (DUF327 family)
LQKLLELQNQCSNAGDAFKFSPSSSTCQAYKNSLELFIEFVKATPNYTNAELDQFQQVADGIDCSIY